MKKKKKKKAVNLLNVITTYNVSRFLNNSILLGITVISLNCKSLHQYD